MIKDSLYISQGNHAFISVVNPCSVQQV